MFPVRFCVVLFALLACTEALYKCATARIGRRTRTPIECRPARTYATSFIVDFPSVPCNVRGVELKVCAHDMFKPQLELLEPMDRGVVHRHGARDEAVVYVTMYCDRAPRGPQSLGAAPALPPTITAIEDVDD